MKPVFIAMWFFLALPPNFGEEGRKLQQSDAAPVEDQTFLITGVLAGIVGKTVFALPIDTSGNVLTTFCVGKSGALVLNNPSGVTDGEGRFTITLRLDNASEGKKCLSRIALCWDPGLLDNLQQVVVVDVPKESNQVDARTSYFTRLQKGTKLLNHASMQSGSRFNLDGRWVMTERRASTLILKLESPIRFKKKGCTIQAASLIVEANGVPVWDNVTTAAKSGPPVQWEAVPENGWVEGYRMLNANLTSLQGQEVAIPTPSGNVLTGWVEGDKILVKK